MKSSTTLASFINYCLEHPEERFWQALRNWSGFTFIYGSNDGPAPRFLKDTYYWEGRSS